MSPPGLSLGCKAASVRATLLKARGGGLHRAGFAPVHETAGRSIRRWHVLSARACKLDSFCECNVMLLILLPTVDMNRLAMMMVTVMVILKDSDNVVQGLSKTECFCNLQYKPTSAAHSSAETSSSTCAGGTSNLLCPPFPNKKQSMTYYVLP